MSRTLDHHSNALALAKDASLEKTCDTERTPYPSDMVAEHRGWRSRERISERTDEQIVDESLESARADLAETEKSSTSRDRILQGTVERVLHVPVPEMVEQLVKLPKTVSEDGIQQRTVEQTVDIPVPQVVKGLVKVSKVKGTNMSTKDFEKSVWFQSKQMFIDAPTEVCFYVQIERPKG